MKNKDARRRVPISAVTMAAIAVLFAFEAMVIGGAFEVKASRIAKVAPWAYEPFLKLVGEHPDSYRQRNDLSTAEEARPDGVSALDELTGLPAVPEANKAPAPAVSNKTDAAEIRPQEPAAEDSKEPVDDDVPVG